MNIHQDIAIHGTVQSYLWRMNCHWKGYYRTPVTIWKTSSTWPFKTPEEQVEMDAPKRMRSASSRPSCVKVRIIIPFPRLTMSDHEIFENHQPVITRERNCPHWGLSEAGGIHGSFTGLRFSDPSPDSPSAGTMHRAMSLLPL